MTGLQFILRILLSLGIFVAGFGSAMPVASASETVTPSHCDEEVAQSTIGQGALQGADALHHHGAGHEHLKAGGCCKAGSCPCPHVVAGSGIDAVAINAVASTAADFRAPVSGYRSPSLARLVRPPIG